jgi:hypothetical protein
MELLVVIAMLEMVVYIILVVIMKNVLNVVDNIFHVDVNRRKYYGV